MSIDFDVTNNELRTKRYTATFDLALQQKDSKLMSKVLKGKTFEKGAEKLQEVVRYDEASLKEVTGLNQTISHTNQTYQQRWVKGRRFLDAKLLNNFEQLLDMVQNPSSAIAQSQAKAARRKVDEIILGKFFTNADTGTDGGQSTAFDTANTVAVTVGGGGSATGLNMEKFDAVKEQMLFNEIDLEDEYACMVITEKQMTNLAQLIEANNSDYQAAHAVVRDGKGGIKSIKGIELVTISSGRLAKYESDAKLLDGSSYRRCPVFTNQAMSFSSWEMQKTSIDQMKTIEGHPWQFYIEMYIGATRLDEKRVFEIKCSE